MTKTSNKSTEIVVTNDGEMFFLGKCLHKKACLM